jgi:tripartite-type tricarboxylate transporter receptor subunit TctC
MLKTLACLVVVGLICLVMRSERAGAVDAYPVRTVRIVVPFAPGGPTDLLARGLAQRLSIVWKQAVIVENRTGAGGIIGLKAALDAPRDGYTLVVHSDAISVAPAIYGNLPFDVVKDFQPVALLAHTPNVVVVGENSPYHSLKELALAGQVSKKLSYASAGVGSAMHMQAAKFVNLAHISDPVHIPFKGTPEALNATMAGDADFVFAPLSNAVPLIKAGKVRPLATSAGVRTSFLPDVPTVAEAGFSGYAEEQFWGLFVPAGVPSEITAKIEAEAENAMRTPEMIALVLDLSSTVGDTFGSDFASLLRTIVSGNVLTAKADNIHAY